VDIHLKVDFVVHPLPGKQFHKRRIVVKFEMMKTGFYNGNYFASL
jgi:hypothetical protein